MTVSSLKKIEFGKLYTRKDAKNLAFRIVLRHKNFYASPWNENSFSISDYIIYEDGSLSQTHNSLLKDQVISILKAEPLIRCKSDIEAKIFLLFNNDSN